MTLEEIGLTKEEIQERIIEKLCDKILQGVSWDEDGEAFVRDSNFARKLDERVKKSVDDTIDKLFKKHIHPNVKQFIETLTLQETNKWGEKKGTKLTFVEYLVQRAEAYLKEEVDHQGKPKGTDSYSWHPRSTRLVHLVHQHLDHAISTAMTTAMKVSNQTISEALLATAKIKLAEIATSIKVQTETKS